jgi:hypothetical protein
LHVYLSHRRFPATDLLATILFSRLRLRLPKVFSAFSFSLLNFILIYFVSHACYIPFLLRTPLFDYPNNIRGDVEIVKALIVELPPSSCHFPSHSSRYSPSAPCFIFLAYSSILIEVLLTDYTASLPSHHHNNITS